MTSRPSRRRSGLTLLEVLAAAMIFAMVMTVLICTSSTAVHSVGVSSRRLEANLLADGVLADLEIMMKQGYAPDVSEFPTESEGFAVQATRIDVLGDAAGTPGGALADLAGGSGDIASVLATELPEVASYLRQYELEVSWIEQDGTHSVTRTTFAYDWDLASEELGDLFASAAGGSAGTGRGSGSDSGDGNASGGSRRSNNDRAQGGQGATEAEKAFFRESNRLRRQDGHNARRDSGLRRGGVPGSEYRERSLRERQGR